MTGPTAPTPPAATPTLPGRKGAAMTKRTRPRRVKAERRRVKAVALLQRWLLPRTAADYDAMVEQMTVAAAARLLTWPVVHRRAKELVRPDIIVALRAIGIARPKS